MRATQNWMTPPRWLRRALFAVVLELVTPEVAKEITERFSSPPSASALARTATANPVTPDLIERTVVHARLCRRS